MSNAFYRYYNSAQGVGLILVPPGDEPIIHIAGRVKLHGKKALAWARRSDLYLSVEEAKGKPFAQFFVDKPEQDATSHGSKGA